MFHQGPVRMVIVHDAYLDPFVRLTVHCLCWSTQCHFDFLVSGLFFEFFRSLFEKFLSERRAACSKTSRSPLQDFLGNRHTL